MIFLEKTNHFGQYHENNMILFYHQVKDMSKRLKCQNGELPFVYLGLKMGANMKLYKNWQPVLDLVENRLSLWKANNLSIGGRLTLLRSVFECLPVYYFSIFKAPVRVINKLEGLRRRFLWGGNKEKTVINWVSWETVTKRKEDGGLGLTPLKEFNISLLTKWLWRYKNEHSRLWRRVIYALHGSNRSFKLFPCKSNSSGAWKTITNLEPELERYGIKVNNLLKAKVGNGKKTQFWIENWWGNIILKDRYPELFKLETRKGANVADRIKTDDNGVRFLWEWRKKPNTQNVISELKDMTDLLQSVAISNTEDIWIWESDNNIGFTVKTVRELICKSTSDRNQKIFPWIKWVPIKINIFGWRALLDRLPTRSALAKRNIQFRSSQCPRCEESEESLGHLFTGCRDTLLIWMEIEKWCKISPIVAFDVADLIFLHNFVDGSVKKKIMIQVVILATCWVIWNARNNLIFNNRKTTTKVMFREIQAIGYLWIKHRTKTKISDEEWLDFNFK